MFIREIKRAARSSFPEQERFQLLPQLSRALDSIVLNVAEGSDRRSDKDFSQFLSIALASLNEVVACLDIALDEAYMSPPQHARFLERAAAIGNQLSAFKACVESKVKRQKSKVA